MPIEIKVPNLGESIVEATVADWLKHEGDQVKVGEPVVVLETDKVDLEVGAEHDGVLSRIVHPKGDDVKIGDILAILDETALPVEKPKRDVVETPTIAHAEKVEEKATPVARRLAQEQGIDLAQVTASGPRGKVTKEDVQRHLTQGQPVPLLNPLSDGQRREERVKMSRRRRTIAHRLVEAQQTAAMLTTFNEVDMSAVMDLRTRRKESFKERYGVGLGITSFFVKAAIGALKDFPQLNAEIDGTDLILKYYYDIGIAVGASEGLVVPVLRDADRMSFAQIEKTIKQFAEQAEDSTLTLDDLRGGTFTITNGGVFGSLMSTPILNLPQVGILGLHKIEQRPVVVNGQIVIRSMMYIAMSYDHRIIDGRESVQFLVRIKQLVEDPESLLLEG
jgi:2-oxoglutarate dehydrogenase E2 component (dihydrolipoamide succinyltransferase)